MLSKPYCKSEKTTEDTFLILEKKDFLSRIPTNLTTSGLKMGGAPSTSFSEGCWRRRSSQTENSSNQTGILGIPKQDPTRTELRSSPKMQDPAHMRARTHTAPGDSKSSRAAVLKVYEHTVCRKGACGVASQRCPHTESPVVRNPHYSCSAVVQTATSSPWSREAHL